VVFASCLDAVVSVAERLPVALVPEQPLVTTVRHYISYDSTNKNCQAGDIDIVEYGHSKDGNGGPVFNVSIAYDTKNREPLFYEEYPGSIVDVAQLQYMLNAAKGYGYKHVGFILDRGYFSQANIHYMDSSGYDFVIMAKGLKALVKEAVLTVQGTFENKRAYSIRKYKVNGITVRKQLYPSDANQRYFHIYYDPAKSAAERTHLEDKLAKLEKLLRRMEGKPFELDRQIYLSTWASAYGSALRPLPPDSTLLYPSHLLSANPYCPARCEFSLVLSLKKTNSHLFQSPILWADYLHLVG